MMTLKEIHASKINLDIAKEAYTQAEKKLNDILDTKKQFEQKAFILFSGYLTSAIGLFVLRLTLFNNKKLFSVFIVSSIILLLGVVSFCIALRTAQYGSLGSSPKMWLEKYILEGDNNMLSKMFAYLTFYCHEKIDISLKSNNLKAFFIDLGIYFGIIAIGIFIVRIIILIS